jgi:hypothetical protein
MGHHFKDKDITVDDSKLVGGPRWHVRFPREENSNIVVDMHIPKVGVFEDPAKPLEHDYCENDLAPKIAKVLRDVLK